MSFFSSRVPSFLLQSLQRMGVETPTNIQEEAIPKLLDGSDGLITAQTGSGKTLAYLVPAISKVIEEQNRSVLVLAPTRELATQIGSVAIKCASGSNIKVAVLVGGQPMGHQLRQLSKKPRLIVGTPGRVFDHIERRTFNANSIGCFVLDEVDRMLDLGFSVQIADIEKNLPKNRQTLMFSATLPPQTTRIADRYLSKDFVRISGGSLNEPPREIDHTSKKMMPSEKFESLISELDNREGSVVVFVNKKFEARKIALRLKDKGHQADSIHGDLRQSARDRVLRNFRRQKTRVMVGTDVVARGLDVDHVKHVINYDLPMCPEDYLHRIGRTGRAGESGSAFSMISPDENLKWRAIQRLIDPEQYKKDKEAAGGSFSRRPGRGGGSGRGFGGQGGGRFGKKRSFGSFKKGFGGKRSSDGRGERSRSFDRSEDSFGKKKSFGKTFSRSESRFGSRSDSRSDFKFDSKPKKFDRKKSENKERFGWPLNKGKKKRPNSEFSKNKNRRPIEMA